MKKRIIFHIPLKLDPELHSASQIRPQMMLKGFIDSGYEVDVIEGFAKERKDAIKKIKRNIKNGIKYDFIYSEASTMPTLLTESHHLPIHPFLDFNFFKFCKRRGIKIGLFYRDIYWVFPENIINWKNKIAKLFYLYDLKKYTQLVDVLFLPSKEMSSYIPRHDLPPIYELPSGAKISLENVNNNDSDYIKLFYVGGIGHHYDLSILFNVIKDFPNIHLTICCREADWILVKELYMPLISENISIIHQSGNELNRFYQKADLCILFVNPTAYWKFAMPYKLFEYIGHGKPVLASKGTLASQFIENFKCGIVSDYNENALREVLSNLSHDNLFKLSRKVAEFAPSQSWKARAQEVANSLT